MDRAELNEKRTHALAWLHKWANYKKEREFNDDIHVIGFVDGVFLVNAREMAGLAGLTLTMEVTGKIRIEYFIFDGVKFYDYFQVKEMEG